MSVNEIYAPLSFLSCLLSCLELSLDPSCGTTQETTLSHKKSFILELSFCGCLFEGVFLWVSCCECFFVGVLLWVFFCGCPFVIVFLCVSCCEYFFVGVFLWLFFCGCLFVGVFCWVSFCETSASLPLLRSPFCVRLVVFLCVFVYEISAPLSLLGWFLVCVFLSASFCEMPCSFSLLCALCVCASFWAFMGLFCKRDP